MNPTLPTPNDSPASNEPNRLQAVQPSLTSDDILRGHKAVEIKHNGSTYKLQATRLGKLILTK